MPFVLTAALTPAVARADTSTTSPHKKLPAADPQRPVQNDGKGHCWQHPEEHCPPDVHCNPGPPIEVQCPVPDKTPPKK